MFTPQLDLQGVESARHEGELCGLQQALLIHHDLPDHVIEEALARRSAQLTRTPTKTPTRSASTPPTFRTPESAPASPQSPRRPAESLSPTVTQLAAQESLSSHSGPPMQLNLSLQVFAPLAIGSAPTSGESEHD